MMMMKAFLDQKLSMLDIESWKFVMKEDEEWEVGGERNRVGMLLMYLRVPQ